MKVQKPVQRAVPYFTFKTKQDFLGKIRNVVKKDDTILVKASHGMEFPEIIDVLRQMKF